MKPYKVLIFIVCVMAGLAALCLVLPGRIAMGDQELRWPTLAEVLETEETIASQDSLENLGSPETPESPDSPVSTAPKDTVAPVIPKVSKCRLIRSQTAVCSLLRSMLRWRRVANGWYAWYTMATARSRKTG